MKSETAKFGAQQQFLWMPNWYKPVEPPTSVLMSVACTKKNISVFFSVSLSLHFYSQSFSIFFFRQIFVDCIITVEWVYGSASFCRLNVDALTRNEESDNSLRWKKNSLFSSILSKNIFLGKLNVNKRVMIRELWGSSGYECFLKNSQQDSTAEKSFKSSTLIHTMIRYLRNEYVCTVKWTYVCLLYPWTVGPWRFSSCSLTFFFLFFEQQKNYFFSSSSSLR